MAAPDIAIDRDIPPPAARWPKIAWPFADMQIGDSIRVPPDRVAAAKSALSRYCRVDAPERRFTRRKVGGGIRIWRIT